MTWIKRTVHSCQWREPRENGNAVCGLLAELSGVVAKELAQVSREVCASCCRNFPPALGAPNPTVASMLFQMAEQISERGGVPGCDKKRADRLREASKRFIPLALPGEDDAVIPAGMIHSQNPDAWPAVAQIVPRPEVQSAERIASWSVGVTTSPRRLPTLEICLDSLARAGWTDVRLFVDNHGNVPGNYMALPVTRRNQRIGAWPNFHLGLLEMFQRNPQADAYMMVQDDVIFYEHPGLRQYLEEVLWPGHERCVLSLFCSQLYAREHSGWHRFNGQWQWGAQVFVFPRAVLQEFLSSREVLDHRTDGRNGLVLIDHLVGKWTESNGIPIYFPTPSLAQHIGDTSTLWQSSRINGGRRAAPFAGDLVEFQTGALPAPASAGLTSISPVVASTRVSSPAVGRRTVVDCLGRTEMIVPDVPITADDCIATVASDGFEHWLDDMLGSLFANGQCPHAVVVVFVLEGSERCIEVARKYNVRVVRCRQVSRVNATLKSVMYSIGQVVAAKRFVCMDADMIVLDDLASLFTTLDTLPSGSILACRESNQRKHRDLEHAFELSYGGRPGELASLLGADERERTYPLVVNDGLFAGSREALLNLDAKIREMPSGREWVDRDEQIKWRNQFVFNLAMARLDCGVELDPRYNLQLWFQDVALEYRFGRMRATWDSRPVHVLHFCSLGRFPGGRDKYPNWRGHFAAVPQPLIGNGSDRNGDGYGAFLRGLRAWVGRRGVSALKWSFYGTPDGVSAAVSDPADFPAFAFLYFLVRSSGCRAVIECGTGFGVSTACLAAAVSPAGQVLTIDIEPNAEREELWHELDLRTRQCIRPLVDDSLQVMDRLIARGERFDLALLDSLHTEQHVWEEFNRAAQLVRPGGLILVHDVLLPNGTVEAALCRISAAGYGVSRLWTTEGVSADDNGLGIAVIENRRRTR